MIAGTLSTIRPSLVPPRFEHGRPAGEGAGTGAAYPTRLNPDEVFQVSTAPAEYRHGPAPAARAAAAPCRAADRMEFEARGLLNLIGFVTRCLDGGAGATHEERQRWRRQIENSNARLESLYEAGLPRDFLSAQRKGEQPVLQTVGR